MTWKLTKAQDGAPVWCGFDSIYDPHFERRTWAWMTLVVAMYVIGLPVSVAGAILLPWAVWESATGGWSEPPEASYVYGILWLICLVMALAIIFTLKEILAERPRQFICRWWTLSGSSNQLDYRAEQFDAPLDARQVSRDGTRWSVPLDAVSRVESGPTSQWQRARRYEGKPDHSRDGFAPIPPFEFQTFLFLNDGSRRVIATVNGDPEGAGTLAHSIRSWIEAQRNEAQAKTNSPAALVTAGEEGYDL